MRWPWSKPQITYRCEVCGRPGVDRKYDAPEFTNLAFACNECGRDVPEDDAGPSCGAHVLHIECGPWFGCDHCYLVRAEIP